MANGALQKIAVGADTTIIIRSVSKKCLKKNSLKWTQIDDPASMRGEEETHNVLFSLLFLSSSTTVILLLWGIMGDSANLGKLPEHHKSESISGCSNKRELYASSPLTVKKL